MQIAQLTQFNTTHAIQHDSRNTTQLKQLTQLIVPRSYLPRPGRCNFFIDNILREILVTDFFWPKQHRVHCHNKAHLFFLQHCVIVTAPSP